MPHFIVRDVEKSCLDASLVGNKAANLAVLRARATPVPSFFVISTQVYGRYCNAAGISRRGMRDSSSQEHFRRCADYFSTLRYGGREMPASFWRDFENFYSSLPGAIGGGEPAVAVRSSSPFEDTVSHSFAGQFATTLYVHGVTAVWEAIKKCWASLWDGRVASYLHHHNLDRHGLAMAVIVQRMLDVDVSGVLFTREPLQGDDAVMLVEANAGSAGGVVGGSGVQWRALIDKRNLKAGPVPGSPISPEPLLSEDRVGALAQACKGVEDTFGSAQDIEWAYAGGELWILQSRPLTVHEENQRQRMDGEGRGWTDYFFVERFVDPVSPLGWSIIGKWIEKRAFIEPLRYLGFDGLCSRGGITRLFDYRPFTRVEVFQSLYSVVPEFAMSADKKNAFLGGLKRSYWPGALLRRAPFLCSRLVLRDRNWIPWLHLRSWRRFLPRYLGQIKGNAEPLAEMAWGDLRRWFARAELLSDELLSYHRWSITFADLYFHLLELLLRKWVDGATPATAIELVSGLPGNKTVEASTAIGRLARSIAKAKDKGAHDRKPASEEESRAALLDDPGFKSDLEQLLMHHGHRSQNLDPYYPTWREDPRFLLSMAYEMSDDAGKWHLEATQMQLAQRRRRTEALIFDKLASQRVITGAVRAEIVREVLGMAQTFVSLRENQRYYWQMALAETRRIIREVGRRLAAGEILASAGDVFFLERQEFMSCLDADADMSTLSTTVEKRLEHWQSVTRREQGAGSTRRIGSVTLYGLGVSAGRAHGRATVARSLAEAEKMPRGNILVAPSLDPAWTPLFSRASGLVLEVGGILSHAAIVAREFRLPAVTGISGATSLISEHQLVYVNADAGTVQLLAE